MAETRPKPVPALDETEPEVPGMGATPTESGPTRRRARDLDEPSDVKDLVLQTELLDELRRMNRLLAGISRGPRRYTLAFFSGIVRGLGAAIGATVVFALLVGVLSRVNTIPLIGGYLAKVYEFAAQTSPEIGEMGTKLVPTAQPSPESTGAAATPSAPAPAPTPAN